MAVLPCKIEESKNSIKSLLNQIYPLHINLYVCRYHCSQNYVPHFDDNRITVHLEPFVYTSSPYIIMADIDMEYGKTWTKDLLEIASPNYAGGFLGRNFSSEYIKWDNVVMPTRVDIILHDYGVIYPSQYLATHDPCTFSDDIYISSHLSKNSIPMYVYPGSCDIKSTNTYHLKQFRQLV